LKKVHSFPSDPSFDNNWRIHVEESLKAAKEAPSNPSSCTAPSASDPVTVSETQAAINKAKTKSAPEKDQITYKQLKCCIQES
jgi:hypothetical protein